MPEVPALGVPLLPGMPLPREPVPGRPLSPPDGVLPPVELPELPPDGMPPPAEPPALPPPEGMPAPPALPLPALPPEGIPAPPPELPPEGTLSPEESPPPAAPPPDGIEGVPGAPGAPPFESDEQALIARPSSTGKTIVQSLAEPLSNDMTERIFFRICARIIRSDGASRNARKDTANAATEWSMRDEQR